MNVFIVVHRFKQGDSLEVFSAKKSAKTRFRQLMREYATEGQFSINADADNDSELYEASGGDIALCIVKCEVQS